MSDKKGEAISSGVHAVLALDKMKSLREKSALCDVTLLIADTKIPAHRIILAASSPYFEFMFTSSHVTESTKDSIEIKGFCPKAFQALVDFMYSGYLYANEDTIVDLLEVADFLKVVSAKEQCLNYLQRHMSVSNCIMIRNIARKYYFLELEKKVNNFISRHFLDVIQSEGFLGLSIDELKNFVAEDSFCPEESSCGKAISSWVDHDKCSRKEFEENISQFSNVCTETRKEKGLNVYNASQHSRIYFYYKNPDNNWAFDVDNLTWHCVRSRLVLEYMQALFHDNSICLISAKGSECGIYDLKEEKWMSNVMPFKNLYSGACSDHNRIYLTTSDDSKATYSYDVRNNALCMEPPLIRKRTSPGVTFNENCIYVCGGTCGSAEFRDIRTKDWRPITNLPKGSENVSATSMDNKVYCLSSSRNLLQYDKRKGVWIKKAPIPVKQANDKTGDRLSAHFDLDNRCKLGATDESLYASWEEEQSLLYKYDPNKDEWKVLISGLTASDFVCVYPR